MSLVFVVVGNVQEVITTITTITMAMDMAMTIAIAIAIAIAAARARTFIRIEERKKKKKKRQRVRLHQNQIKTVVEAVASTAWKPVSVASGAPARHLSNSIGAPLPGLGEQRHDVLQGSPKLAQLVRATSPHSLHSMPVPGLRQVAWVAPI
ncbi:hypothetical protein K504DRAFT_506012 [Pleomassaria siparia CBS 279.74]|uniref:Uncharacterized protein n=1 Tax=Pleomassaria siparia CBS 279.74 TaxID=1314801 RepID=A0A6G1JYC1_9PLEO|nr:hypothetical protein K504DRAFT_506012 [Pleomassaria siparia CBS 279.74]